MDITTKHSVPLFISLVLLATLVFAFDSWVELGVAGGVPYVVVVCLSYLAARRSWIFVTAVCCCLLTLLGYLLSPPGGEEWKVLYNRGLALLAITVTAVFADMAKRAAQRLTDNERNLERLVDQRTGELKLTNAELEASNEELKNFAYIASHDLQTPLRSIHGFAEILREDAAEQLDNSASENIDRIIAASERMKTLISDLLSYSHLEGDSSRYSTVSLNEVFDEVLALLSAEIIDSGAEITRDNLPELFCDRGQMIQLLQNLIGNGIKYCDRPIPQVHVSAHYENNNWVVSVQDNGIGIEPEYHGRVFDIFRRLHDSKSYPGTGIGLAVCRRVVEHHQGRIWIDSEAKCGTRVLFSLPQPVAKTQEDSRCLVADNLKVEV